MVNSPLISLISWGGVFYGSQPRLFGEAAFGPARCESFDDLQALPGEYTALCAAGAFTFEDLKKMGCKIYPSSP